MAINFSEFKKGDIILLIVSAKKYLDASLEVLKHYCNSKDSSCVYVSVNRTFDVLMALLKQSKIRTEKMFIVDAITAVSSRTYENENAVFIGSPKGLTDISISASAAINAFKGEKMLFFDSLSTLLLYNDIGSVTKFAHFLINKMKEWGASGVIISLEKETDDKLRSQLSQFVDKIIEIK